eukprot:4354375-Pyramimonas_sp.AAC.1
MVMLWRAMLRMGSVPPVFAHILLSLIPKPASGDRPVAVFSTSVRSCTRWLRRSWGSQWAREHDRPHLFGVAGKSSVQCVWRQAVLTELAHARGW